MSLASLRFFIFLIALSTSLIGVAAENERIPFDHRNTGFDLTGSHNFIACESCHVGGKFKGTPTQCTLCHSLNSLVNASPKPVSHIITTDTCDNCHRDTQWNDIKQVDHSQVFGSCTGCHNNISAEGKPPHILTNSQCDACHSNQSWTPATFDHSNITNGCIGCHDGTTATGKNQQHILSNNSCELCHSNIAWEPASVDHTAVSGSCASCHNGSIAEGKNPTHLSTTAECGLCHSTTAWIPATFDHSNVTDNCSSCHNNITATGKNPGHFGSNQECNACHRITAWLPDTFRHTSANYPGDHRSNLDCTDCHSTNAEVVNWSFPAYAPDCAGCHANDYESDAHKKVDTPTIRYSVMELKDCTGACHEYTDTSLTTIKKMRTTHHRVSDGEF
jgi:hypothetical protein